MERLEQRLALSVSASTSSLLSVVSIAPQDQSSVALIPTTTDPPSQAVLTSSPGSVTIHFNGQIDPGSLGLQGGDAVIAVQGPDGGWTSVFDDLSLPAETVTVGPTVGTSDLTLTLAPGQTLPVGHYAIVLSDITQITDTNGNPVTFSATPNLQLMDQGVGPFYGGDGAGQILSQFSVIKPGVTLADATNLGTLDTKIKSTSSSTLDLADDPSAVALYKFTVPAGHFWQFGAEVDSQRDGGTLSSSLALFDANGKVLAVSSTGRPGTEGDAYLFAGLAPGTYYIGVSGRGNLPGIPGGYDPVAGTPGSISQTQPDGTFHLSMVVTPADSPTKLLGFHLNHADPLDPSPTGLTLAFNGLLDPKSLGGDPIAGIVVVNKDGQQFGMSLTSYNESSGRYTFMFDGKLPAGSYTIEIPRTGGATDLIGRTPVAHGEPSGVLGTFDTVNEPVSALIPNNLGALSPNNLAAGITNETTILPGTAVAYRFVVEYSALLDFDFKAVGGSLNVQMMGVGASSFDRSGVIVKGSTEQARVLLAEGVYSIEFTNSGTTPLSLAWTVQQRTRPDSITASGLGQAPARVIILNNGSGPGSGLSLGSVDPTIGGPLSGGTLAGFGPNAPTPTAAPPSTGPGSSVPSSPGNTPGPGLGPQLAFSTGPSFAPPGLGGLYLTVGGLPVGKPTTQNDQVEVAGPGPTALASSAAGLLQGISYGQSRMRASERFGESVLNQDPSAPAPVNGAMEVAARPDDVTRADEVALVSSEWLGRVGTFAADWLRLTPDTTEVAPVIPEGGTVEVTSEAIVTNGEGGRAKYSGRVEQANFGAPVFFGLGSVLALRVSPTFRRWLARSRGSQPTRRGSMPKGVIRGPHRKF